jgi:hypothetical protein
MAQPRRNPIRRRSSASGYFARVAALPSTAPGPRPELLHPTSRPDQRAAADERR